jgi:hypothetical protein
MGEQKMLRVHLEFGEAKADFEGDVNQVFEAIVRFLANVYPNLEVLQSIVYTPDLAGISKKLVGLVEITSDGPVLVSEVEMSARDAMCIALLGTYVGKRLGRLLKETLSSSELAKIVGKARKTISNELPRLMSEGTVERTEDQEYRLTTLGIRKTEDTIV